MSHGKLLLLGLATSGCRAVARTTDESAMGPFFDSGDTGKPETEVVDEPDTSATTDSSAAKDTASSTYLLVTVKFDHGDDGSIESVSYLAYDEEGWMLQEDFDGEAGGTPDSRLTCTYDDNGKLLAYAIDYDIDGVVDH